MNKITKAKEILQKKIQTLESQKRDLIVEKDKLLVNQSALEKDLDFWRKLHENEKRGVDDLKREKELLYKNFQRING